MNKPINVMLDGWHLLESSKLGNLLRKHSKLTQADEVIVIRI